MISVDITFCLFDFFYQRNGMELKSAVDYLREKNPFVKEIDIYSNINYGIQKGYIRVKDGIIAHGGEEIAGPDLKNISKCVQEMLSGANLKRSDIMLRLCKDYGYVCDCSMKRVVQEVLKKGTASSYYKKDTRVSRLLVKKGRKNRASSTRSKASGLKSTVKKGRKDQASSTRSKASGFKSTVKKGRKDQASSTRSKASGFKSTVKQGGKDRASSTRSKVKVEETPTESTQSREVLKTEMQTACKKMQSQNTQQEARQGKEEKLNI